MAETSAEREIGSHLLGTSKADAVVEEDEPAKAPKSAPRPTAQTKADIAAHEPLHLDYRSWCAHCVFGRGHSTHHRTGDDQSVSATWHMDYAFLGENCDVRDVEEAASGNATMLITYDESKHAFWAMHVPRKGPAPGVAKWCCDRLEDSGYGGNGITIKTDQEESIVALRRAVSVLRLGETVPINSPVRCSKANGRMENAVKIYCGHLRTLKHAFESSSLK